MQLEDSDLGEMRKGADEKALIAAILREETTVPLAWITGRLKMGTTANVSRASIAATRRLPKDRALRRARRNINAKISS